MALFDKRYIPIIQICNKKLVKTVQFKVKRYLGDPLNAIRVFNLKEVSEIIVLDIEATRTKKINFNYLRKLAAQAFVPLTYGGGIMSLADIDKLFEIGFDKIIFGSASVEVPNIIQATAQKYGSQSIICSLDIYKGLLGYRITYEGNARCIKIHNLKDFLNKLIELGAGEILLHDINRDGTFKGLDYQLIKEISELSPIPIIASGGANAINDMEQAISSGASAIAAGSIFSFYGKHRAVLINYCVEK